MYIPAISPTGLVGRAVKLVWGPKDTPEDVSVPDNTVIAVLLTQEQATDLLNSYNGGTWVCDLNTTVGQYSDLWQQDRTWNVTLDVAMTARVTLEVEAHDEESARYEACETVEQGAYVSCGEGEVTDEDVSDVDVVECTSEED